MNAPKPKIGLLRRGMDTVPFLAASSRLGGTHHLALSYGAPVKTITAFGRMMGWDVQVIS